MPLQVRKTAEAARKLAAKQLRSGGGILDSALKSGHGHGPAGTGHQRLLPAANDAGAQDISQVFIVVVKITPTPTLGALGMLGRERLARREMLTSSRLPPDACQLNATRPPSATKEIDTAAQLGVSSGSLAVWLAVHV